MWVTWDPSGTDHIIVATTGSAMESTDRGSSWDALDIPDGASLVEMNPQDPGVLYAAVLDARRLTCSSVATGAGPGGSHERGSFRAVSSQG